MGMIQTCIDVVRDLFWLILFVIVVLFITNVRDGFDIGGVREITYYTFPSSVDPTFVQQVRSILAAGDWYGKFTVREVNSLSDAIVGIKLATKEELDEWHLEPEYYPSGKQIRFSITTQNWNTKPKIYIDPDNWLKGVPESGLTIEEYRRYVILHEFLHGAGYDHQKCDETTAVNGICSVLYQSTRGCPAGYKCGSRVLPVDFTKKLTPRYLL
jgi:hypothetical protein